MSCQEDMRERLEQLLRLAQAYRGWTRRQLANAIGRNASKLIPESGVPKLDVVINLARILDWPIEQLVDALWHDSRRKADPPDDSLSSFESLDKAGFLAHQEGRYTDMIHLARRAYSLARDSEERAEACNREAGGWDGLGLYRNALTALRRGLVETPLCLETEMLLRGNLANAHYTLWSLTEGIGVAHDLVAHFVYSPPHSPTEKLSSAMAHYARGHSYRRLAGRCAVESRSLARLAELDLLTARGLYIDVAEQFGQSSYLGIADTCEAGALEAQVLLGQCDADSALSAYADSIERLAAGGDGPTGDALEHIGWRCIFACNVALRHISNSDEQQRLVAVFSNKADEIAHRLGNWSLHERVLAIDFAQAIAPARDPGEHRGWTIDTDDVRSITGTMGRFRTFYEAGWKILRAANVVDNDAKQVDCRDSHNVHEATPTSRVANAQGSTIPAARTDPLCG